MEENRQANSAIDENTSSRLADANDAPEHTGETIQTEAEELKTGSGYSYKGNVHYDNTVYAGFWIRFWAYIIDIALIAGIRGIIIRPFTENFEWFNAGGFFSAANVLSAILFYLYFVLMTKQFGQTLGKMIFGIKVISLNNEKLTWTAVIFREWIGRYISATFIFLYAVAAFTEKKQNLHDLIADTAVVHERIVLKEPVISFK